MTKEGASARGSSTQARGPDTSPPPSGSPAPTQSVGGGWAMVMAETTEDLLSGGYCFSIRHFGPFVVGEDFEAPGPAARVLPNLPTDRQTWDKLWSHIPAENTAGSDELSDQ